MSRPNMQSSLLSVLFKCTELLQMQTAAAESLPSRYLDSHIQFTPISLPWVAAFSSQPQGRGGDFTFPFLSHDYIGRNVASPLHTCASKLNSAKQFVVLLQTMCLFCCVTLVSLCHPLCSPGLPQTLSSPPTSASQVLKLQA